MNQTELRAAISLAAVYVLRMLGLFMVMPVLAILAQDFDDYSPLLLGLAIGGYGLTQAILQIPMGVMSDKFGRKPIILVGLVMFALGSWVAASADSMLWIVIGRFLQGAGAIAGAIMALAGDVSRENQRPKVMAIIGISIGFSFYLALLLGPLIAQSYGLQGIFGITAVLAVLCIPLILWVVPNAKNLAPSGDTLPVVEDLKRLFLHPNLVRLNIGVCVLHMMITLLFVQLPGLLVQHDLTLEQHWSVYLPILISSVLGMAALMTVSRKKGQRSIILVSITLLTLSFIGLAIVGTSFWGLMLLAWLFFTGFNFLEANFPSMVSSIAPAGKKGSAMGIYASFQFFGAFLGGVIAGLFQQHFQPESLFVLAAAVCAGWWIIMKGLQKAEKLTRLSFPVSVSKGNASEITKQLASLKGVHDMTLVPEQKVVYLKVDSRVFDIRLARKITGVA